MGPARGGQRTATPLAEVSTATIVLTQPRLNVGTESSPIATGHVSLDGCAENPLSLAVSNPPLSTSVIKGDGGCLILVKGTIDETATANSFVPPSGDVVLYDLGEVRRITSYGVLLWVKALKEVQAKYYGLTRCRPSIVRQINMVTGFAGRGEVLSIYLPYFCKACNREFERLLDLCAHYAVAQAHSPPPERCPHCRADAEFDDAPESYFAFVTDSPAPRPPAVARKLLDSVPTDDLASGRSPRPASMRPPPPPAPSNPDAPDPQRAQRLRSLQSGLDRTKQRLSKIIKTKK